VSTRTVRTDITALNALLAQHGAQFILNRGAGYQLTAAAMRSAVAGAGNAEHPQSSTGNLRRGSG
jgi:hypothetical protein